MNNTHQELIEEKVAEFNKKVDDDYYEVIELTDTTQLKSTLWTEEYWPESQVELSVDKVRAFLTQTLQDTIDTVLEEEKRRVLPYIERIRLDVDVIICKCGEKYKDSDLDLSVQELEEALTPTN